MLCVVLVIKNCFFKNYIGSISCGMPLSKMHLGQLSYKEGSESSSNGQSSKEVKGCALCMEDEA